LSASQADRAGSIPATRSTLSRKGLSQILAIDEKPSFTGSFTVPVHFLPSLSFRVRSLIAAVLAGEVPCPGHILDGKTPQSA
jgi:hypothetical protein